jgi:hypothetical protein
MPRQVEEILKLDGEDFAYLSLTSGKSCLVMLLAGEADPLIFSKDEVAEMVTKLSNLLAKMKG